MLKSPELDIRQITKESFVNRTLTVTFPFIREEQKIGQPLLRPGAREDPVNRGGCGTYILGLGFLCFCSLCSLPLPSPLGDSVMNQWHQRQVKEGQRSVPSTGPP